MRSPIHITKYADGMVTIGIFENDGGYWFYHEGGRTQIGRLIVYWWWTHTRDGLTDTWHRRKMELKVFRFWIGGKRMPHLKNQTNLWTLRAGPFEFQWWMGA